MVHLLNIARALSGLLALGGVVTFVLWTWYPEQVLRFDEGVRKHYIGSFGREIGEARRLIGEEPERAEALLAPIAEKLSAYRREDVRFPQARAVALLRAQTLSKLGDYKGAIGALDLYLQHAPRDLVVAVEAVKVLLASGEGTDLVLAKERAQALFEWLPTSPEVARVYLAIVAMESDRVQYTSALQAALVMVRRPDQAYQNHKKAWDLFWSADNYFHGGARTSSQPTIQGNLLSVSFDAPAGQSFVRLDPPLYCIMDWAAPILIAEVDGQATEWALPKDGRTSGMQSHALGLSVEGTIDPWIEIPLPESLKATAFKLTFSAELSLFPSWLREHAASSVGRDLAVEFAKAGDWTAYNMMRRAWLNARKMEPMHWTGPEGLEETVLLENEGMLLFERQWEVVGEVSELVVTFPALVGDRILLEQCRVNVGDQESDWLVSAELPEFQWRGVEWTTEGGLVTSDQPSLQWKPAAPVAGRVQWDLKGAMQ
ncbi:MAG: hypothetical protein ACI9X4_002302 [Glaciecola sp.]|jgi:hypothetical protein